MVQTFCWIRIHLPSMWSTEQVFSKRKGSQLICHKTTLFNYSPKSEVKYWYLLVVRRTWWSFYSNCEGTVKRIRVNKGFSTSFYPTFAKLYFLYSYDLHRRISVHRSDFNYPLLVMIYLYRGLYLYLWKKIAKAEKFDSQWFTTFIQRLRQKAELSHLLLFIFFLWFFLPYQMLCGGGNLLKEDGLLAQLE